MVCLFPAPGANTNQFSHPLAINDQSNSLNHMEEPLSLNMSTTETNHVNSNQVGSDKSRSSKGHGMCLTTSDHDRLKIFIHEFCIRALIPWAEQQMRWFNEQVGLYFINTMDLSRSLILTKLLNSVFSLSVNSRV